MKKALIVSNRRTREIGGGPEKEDNKDLLKKRGWDVEIGYVPSLSMYTIAKKIPGLARRARSDDIDLMITHCSPPQLHLLGYILKKITGVPWLAEFRDPLVTNPDVKLSSFSHFARRTIEGRVVSSADQIAWWCNIQMSDSYFYETYPDAPKSQFYRIPYLGIGGVDIDKFDSIDVEPYDEFTITYAGSFYDGWIEPYGFLEGLEEYVNRHGDDGLQVRFYGDWKEEYQEEVEDRGLKDVVTPYDPVSHDEIIPILKKSHLLLYIGGDDPRNKLNISLKMADYVASRTAILGIVDPSFRASKFIEKENIGVVATPGEPDSIADSIHAVRSGSFKRDTGNAPIDLFDSQRSMDEFASIMDAVSEGRHYTREESNAKEEVKYMD